MTVKINGKTVCLVVAGVGMGLTVWLTARNTPEAQKRKADALDKKRETTGDENAQLTWFESLKAQVGAYAPAIVTGVVTVGSLVGNEVINKDNLKKAEKTFEEFKEMTDKIGGSGASKVIEKAVDQKKLDEKKERPWDKKEQFRITFQDQVISFEATRAEVMEAIYEANRKFSIYGVVTFNEFLAGLQQEPVKEGDERGWESYVGEAIYGYTWIDFGLKEVEDEPWITEIYMACYPHLIDYDEASKEVDRYAETFNRENQPKKLPDGAQASIDDIPVDIKLEMPEKKRRRSKKAEEES